MNSMAIALSFLEDSEAALTLLGQAITLDLAMKNTRELLIKLKNFSVVAEELGEMARSLQCIQIALDLANASDDEDQVTHGALSYSLFITLNVATMLRRKRSINRYNRDHYVIWKPVYSAKTRYVARMRFYQGGDPDSDLEDAFKEARRTRNAQDCAIYIAFKEKSHWHAGTLHCAESAWLNRIGAGATTWSPPGAIPC